jgi:putative ABC transport system substrate-binding protein
VVLNIGVNPPSAPFYVAFEQRLGELGYTKGQNLVLTYRGPARGESIAEVARAIVRGPVDVLLVTGPEQPLKAAREATDKIPIVMVAINYDPVERGYVASLARPGGNVTGVFFRQLEVSAKQLQLLSTAIPPGGRVGVLWEPFASDQLRVVQEAGRSLGVELLPVEVPPPYDYDRAFAMLRQARVGGIVVLGSPVFFRDRARIHALALRHRLPTIGSAAYADAGSLLGYGPDLPHLFRRAAEYVDRILRGGQPGDIPVEQPSRFELIVNLKTAQAMGVTLPQALVLRADRVIE